jgi:hypothetical protein
MFGLGIINSRVMLVTLEIGGNRFLLVRRLIRRLTNGMIIIRTLPELVFKLM